MFEPSSCCCSAPGTIKLPKSRQSKNPLLPHPTTWAEFRKHELLNPLRCLRTYPTTFSSSLKTLSCQTHLELLQVHGKTKMGLPLETSKFQGYLFSTQTFSKSTLHTRVFQWLIIFLLTPFSYSLVGGINFFHYCKSLIMI